MSSKQQDFKFHLIPQDPEICPTLPNSNGQNSQVLQPSWIEIYFPRINSIAVNVSLRIRKKDKRCTIACLIATIAIVATIITAVVSILLTTTSENGTTVLTLLTSEANEQNNVLNETLRRVVLRDTREIDFESIPQSVEELEVNSLLLINPNTPKVDKNKFIRKLIIACPISEPWIEFLLTTFPEVETLVLNEDEMCGFRTLAVDENKFPRLSLPKLTTLKISNANGKCPLTERIFSKWSLENLKNLSLTHSNIHENYYIIVHKFLNKLKSSIETIEISRSLLCKECDFAFIFNDGYEKLKKIAISRVTKVH